MMGSTAKLTIPALVVVAVAIIVTTLYPSLLPDLLDNLNIESLSSSPTGSGIIMSENSVNNIDGMSFPSDVKIAGSKQSLIGGGTRSKWGFKVYAVGIYSDIKLIKALKKSSTNTSKKNDHLSQEFSESKLARSLLLRFHREVATTQMSEALGEALIDKVGEDSSSQFSKFILDMVGGDKLAKGSDLYITCKGEKLWASLTEGKDADIINVKGLCSAIFQVYLGDSPVSPQAKEGFEKGFADMVV